MKQEKNNEIDLMLRRLSRRQEVPVSDADSDHLDADELSAYAENALPAAARARYTEHLADCSKCREIVVQLSATVPVVAAKETVPAVAASGLRKFLANLFSPMVLRYAVPALGLIVVAAIGFSVLRSRQAPMNVAQSSPAVDTPGVSAKPYQSPSGYYDSNNEQSKSRSAIETRPNAEKPTTAAGEPPPPSAPQSGDFASAKADAPAQKPAEPVAANAAPARAEPVPTPSATVDEMQVEVQGRRNDQSTAQAREVAKQKSAEGFEEREKQEKKVTVQSAPAAAPKTGAGAGTTESGRSFGLMDKAAKDRDAQDGVIRTVAGRRFRKQNGMWVDIAYSSGNNLSEIGRGSERYRSLVADEPEIKKIADELDGVVIVVWKGRTYRIR